MLKLCNLDFWRFHRTNLREMGLEMEWGRVALGAVSEALLEARNPVTAIRKIFAVIREKFTR